MRGRAGMAIGMIQWDDGEPSIPPGSPSITSCAETATASLLAPSLLQEPPMASS
jgi:hypothetical protein